MIMNRIQASVKSDKGFTAIELIVAAGVLGAVAYLVLPFVFPADSKTPSAYLEEDLTSISQIIDVRIQTSRVNNVPIDGVYIGNLGVYSAKSQIRHSVTIKPESGEITYCLRADYKGETRYLESGTGISSSPTGAIDCPGADAKIPLDAEPTAPGTEISEPVAPEPAAPIDPSATEPVAPMEPQAPEPQAPEPQAPEPQAP